MMNSCGESSFSRSSISSQKKCASGTAARSSSIKSCCTARSYWVTTSRAPLLRSVITPWACRISSAALRSAACITVQISLVVMVFSHPLKAENSIAREAKERKREEKMQFVPHNEDRMAKS